MISAYEVALRIATRLEDDGIAYGIGGALALGALGAPRATKDVGITIFLPEAELPRAFDALERAGLLFDRPGAFAPGRRRRPRRAPEPLKTGAGRPPARG